MSHTTSFLGPPHSVRFSGVAHVSCGGAETVGKASARPDGPRALLLVAPSARIRARQSPLAETLLPFLASDEDKAIAAANESLKAFDSLYQEAYAAGMGRKLGFARPAMATTL